MCVALAVTAFLLRNVVVGPALVAGLARWIRAEGGSLGVETWGGSWLGSLELGGVEYESGVPGFPVQEVAGGRLRARYSLLALLRGRLEGLADLELEADRLALDLSAGAEEEEADRPGTVLPKLPAHLPPLRAHVGTLVLALPRGEVLELRDADISVERAGEADPVRLSVEGVSLDERTLPVRAGGTNAVDLRASYAPGRFAIDELAAGDVVVSEAEVALGGGQAAPVASWRLRVRYGRSDLFLAGSVDAETLRLDSCQGVLDAGDAAPWLPPEDPAWQTLKGSLRVNGEARLPLADPLGGSATLRLAGEGLGGGPLTVDALAATLELADRTLSAPELRVEVGANVARVVDLSLPLDATSGSPTALRRAAGTIVLEVRDVTPLLAAAGRPPEAPLPPHHADLELRAEDGSFTVVRGVVETAGGRFEIDRGSLSVPADASSAGDLVLDSEWKLAFDDLGELFRLVGQPDWEGSLSGSVVAEGRLADLTGHVDVEAKDLRWRDHTIGLARCRARVDGEAVTVDELLVDAENASLRASGGWHGDEERLEKVSCTADLGALELLGVSGFTGGPLRVEAALDGPLSALDGSLEAAARDVLLAGVRASELELRVDATGGRVHIEEARVRSPEGELSASATFETPRAGDELVVLVDDLHVAREETELALREPASVVLRGGDVRVGPFDLSGDDGSATLFFSSTGDDLDAQVLLERFLPDPLLETLRPGGPTAGEVNGWLQLQRREGTLVVDASLALEELRLGPDTPSWSVVVEGEARDGQVRIERLAGEQEDGGAFSVQAVLPLDPTAEQVLAPGDLSLSLEASLPGLDVPPNLLGGAQVRMGPLESHAELSGSWSDVRGSLSVGARELEALDDAGRELVPGPLELELAASLADSIELQRGELRLPVGKVRASGSLGTGLDVVGGLGDGWAELLDAALALDARIDLEDVTWLARRTDALRRIDGHVAGRLQVAGTPREPDPSGSLEWTEGEVRLSGDLPLLTGVHSRINVQGEEILLQDLAGDWGGSPFSARGAVVLGEGGTTLELAIEGKDLLLFRGGRSKVRADARLRVAGPMAKLKATGDLVLTDARLGERIDLFAGLRPGSEPPRTAERGIVLSFWREPPLSDLELDVHITSKIPFVIKNNLVQGGLRPDIRLQGTGEVPLILGNVFLEPTRISLPSGRLNVTGGLVRFVPEDPFVPRLDFTGQLRTKGYEVHAVVTGPYDQPDIQLSSTPPLPNDDLLILFLTGQTPKASNGDRGLEAAETVAVYLTQDFILGLFADESEPGDDSLLDRFDFQVGRDVTRSGAPTAEAYFYVLDRPRGPGRAPYLRAERDVYDKINLGFGFLFRFE